jgi:hypothetical protein
MGLSLAHALEFPGKLRLPKDEYMIVQSIYYPGFTIGGMFGEVGAILATAVLAIVTPFGSTEFLLVLAGLLALVIGHIVYWVVIQPVNKVWLKTLEIRARGRRALRCGPQDPAGQDLGAIAQAMGVRAHFACRPRSRRAYGNCDCRCPLSWS